MTLGKTPFVGLLKISRTDRAVLGMWPALQKHVVRPHMRAAIAR
jgi:hypothetical protein